MGKFKRAFFRFIDAIVDFFENEDPVVISPGEVITPVVQRPDEPADPVRNDEYNVNERIIEVCKQLEGNVKEIPGGRHHPKILEMFKVVTGKEYSDETPWCAAAVGYVLDRVGLPHTGELLARSYSSYGKKVEDFEQAIPGDVLVFKRGNSSWKGHVAFFTGNIGNGTIECFGGNQSNAFNRKDYLISDLIAVRSPVVLDLQEQERDIPNRWNSYPFTDSFYERLEELSLEMASLSPSDIANYCDGYSSMTVNDKKNFWVHFLSLMAKKESGINPATQYRENFDDSRGDKVISRGLFQVSIESVNGYRRHGFEGISSASELHNPIINLEAAVFILSHWIKRDGVISAKPRLWRGGARYWSVLRSNTNHSWIKRESLKVFG